MAQGDSLIDLMTQYSLQGLIEWRETDESTRARARTSLQNHIEEDEWRVRDQIKKLYGQSIMKFMPMPKHGYRGVGPFFFIPRNLGGGDECKLSFDLFFLVNEKKSLAFRFEPADQEGYAHNYAHVQFCRKLMGKEIAPSDIPSWLPDSYPAFPLPSSDPLKLFLAMLTTVHGRSRGVEEVIREIFQKASQPNKATKYTDVLKKILDD